MRFLTVICALAAAGFSAVYALATFVSPHTREMTVTIPAARLKPPAPEASAAPHARTAGAEAAADSPTATR